MPLQRSLIICGTLRGDKSMHLLLVMLLLLLLLLVLLLLLFLLFLF